MGTCPYCVKDVQLVNEKWVCCDACEAWCHLHCVNIEDANQIEEYHCPKCEATHGQSTSKPQQRRSSRSQARLNYADLNEGNAAGDERIWGRILAAKSFKKDRFKRYAAKDVNMDLMRKTGFRDPFIVEKNEPELDMKMPPSDINVYDIAKLVGGDDYPVEVIDVASQSESTGWTMGQWASYFHSKDRDRIRNVISLEFSGSELEEQVTRPRIVRELDWIDLMWPVGSNPEEFPKVQLYCLMGTKDSYTDFHIDFGGSSVFYHVISGAKTFYLIEPTAKNLKKYQKWSSSSEQSTTFLGDEVKECVEVKLTAGNTMFIPAGWIHAVHTPEDAIVIGGNFLQSFNIGTQLRVNTIEQETEVPLKFRFPYYKRINWYALHKFSEWLHQTPMQEFSYYELESMALLASYLHKDIKQNRLGIDPSSPLSSADKKQLEIPDTIENPIELTDRVLSLVKQTINNKAQAVQQKKQESPKRIVLKLSTKAPTRPANYSKQQPEVNEEDDDYLEEEDEEDFEEDHKLDDDDEFNIEDDEEYNDEDTIPVDNSNIHKKAENRSRKKITKKVQVQVEKDESSSSDDDSMGTSRPKSSSTMSGLFSNRKRSLSNNSNSSQKSAKQRLLDRISKRY